MDKQEEDFKREGEGVEKKIFTIINPPSLPTYFISSFIHHLHCMENKVCPAGYYGSNFIRGSYDAEQQETSLSGLLKSQKLYSTELSEEIQSPCSPALTHPQQGPLILKTVSNCVSQAHTKINFSEQGF